MYTASVLSLLKHCVLKVNANLLNKKKSKVFCKFLGATFVGDERMNVIAG